LKVEIDKKDCFPSVSSYTVAPYDGSTDVLLIDARSSRTASWGVETAESRRAMAKRAHAESAPATPTVSARAS